MDTVVVVAVHADDETLGCGGSILKHAAMGDTVHWLLLTGPGAAIGWDDAKKKRRQDEISAVTAMYGFSRTFPLNFPSMELDTVPIHILVSSVTKVFNDVKPSVIYMPNASDIHTDHQVASKIIMSCTKNFRFPFIRKVLAYECLSETEFAAPLAHNVFVPNVFVDISEHFARKLEIMKQYPSELMEAPLPRSLEAIEALARFRGSRIGRTYAEAFMLMEEIA